MVLGEEPCGREKADSEAFDSLDGVECSACASRARLAGFRDSGEVSPNIIGRNQARNKPRGMGMSATGALPDAPGLTTLEPWNLM